MLICAFLTKTEISVYFKIKLNLREGRIQINKSNKNIQSLETKKGDTCHNPGNTFPCSFFLFFTIFFHVISCWSLSSATFYPQHTGKNSQNKSCFSLNPQLTLFFPFVLFFLFLPQHCLFFTLFHLLFLFSFGFPLFSLYS